jgi:hypothetical protein
MILFLRHKEICVFFSGNIRLRLAKPRHPPKQSENQKAIDVNGFQVNNENKQRENAILLSIGMDILAAFVFLFAFSLRDLA